jgi:FKBP-type peptidyl-prolyl cis-trans isomerase 2
MKRSLFYVLTALAAFAMLGCAPRVAEKKVAQVRYTGTQADGTVFDSTDQRGGAPMEVMIGGGYWIPFLEQSLIGMKVGDKKRIEVKAAEAFGDYNPALVEEIPKDRFADDMQFKKGLQVQTITFQGPTLATIIEVRPKTVLVDHNHPLAGKDLFFDVEIMKIRDATKEELAPLQGQ